MSTEDYDRRIHQIVDHLGLFQAARDIAEYLDGSFAQATTYFSGAQPDQIRASFQKHIGSEIFVEAIGEYVRSDFGPGWLDELEAVLFCEPAVTIIRRMADTFRSDSLRANMVAGREAIDRIAKSDPRAEMIFGGFAEAYPIIRAVVSAAAYPSDAYGLALYNARNEIGQDSDSPVAYVVDENMLVRMEETRQIAVALSFHALNKISDRDIAYFLAFLNTDTGRRLSFKLDSAVSETVDEALKNMMVDLIRVK